MPVTYAAIGGDHGGGVREDAHNVLLLRLSESRRTRADPPYSTGHSAVSTPISTVTLLKRISMMSASVLPARIEASRQVT
jgi:hypothetical protein